MAIYHFSAQVISRSQGRSSVAAAAYRAAENLLDERTGLRHNFTRKADVVQQAILLPKTAPEWMQDRATLWNAVEQGERRKDAQLAREINVALPLELSEAENWALLTDFVQRECVDHGMVADVALHRGHTGGKAQPHGHVLLTLREVRPDGFGQKVRGWNDRTLLGHWREAWAAYCNLALAKAGFDLRIDHRTLAAQGIALEPQSKIGAAAARSHLERFALHQALAYRNGERLLDDPAIALDALTQQQSTFTLQDMARFINRHSGDAEQFAAVYAKVKACPDLVHLGQDGSGKDRFTTRELLTLESEMVNTAVEGSKLVQHEVCDKQLEQLLEDKQLSQEQRVALQHLAQSGEVACVTGFAGSGKSTLLGAAREVWEAAGYRVLGMTLSAIAAENLTASAGIASLTVASAFWHWDHQIARLLPQDIVVVDEAAMLGSRQLSRVITAARSLGAKVVLVGDPEQLQAIEAGAAYRAIADHVGSVQLTEIWRQQVDWQRLATRDFAHGKTAAAMAAYARHDNVHWFATDDRTLDTLVARWDEVRSQAPGTSQLMLAYTRAEVRQLNEKARGRLQAQGELGHDHRCITAVGERSLAAGERIYFLQNERQALKVNNGTLGTITQIDGEQLQVDVDGVGERRQVSFCLGDYNAIDHGYAATVYKAQGVTVDRTHLLASRYFDRHSAYVALSRHRQGADIYVSRDQFAGFYQLMGIFGRARSKDITLDYAHVRELSLTDDHLRPATSRLVRLSAMESGLAAQAERQLLQKGLKWLGSQTGLSVSFAVRAGDKGIYWGEVTLSGKRFGFLEQVGSQAKLIPADWLLSCEEGKAMVIERQTTETGEERLRGKQLEVELSMREALEIGERCL